MRVIRSTNVNYNRIETHKINNFDICQSKNRLFLLGAEFFRSIFSGAQWK